MRISTAVRLRYLASLVAAMVFSSFQPALGQGEGKTLRQVLVSQDVPLDGAKPINLDQRVTSEAMLNDSAQVVVAYYRADQTNELNPPLFVDRYDRKQGYWLTTALGDGKANHPDFDAACAGPVERIQSIAARLAIETLLNPSAACTLLFSEDLKLEGTLFGWVVGKLGDEELIYERSEVHFAPVHPTEFGFYDLRDKRDTVIFPHKPYQSVWRARIEQLREFYRTHQSWCEANNDPCDPEQFDSSLVGDVTANEKEKALAFVMSFKQIQVFTGDQKPPGPEQVVYVYRNVDDEAKLEYREMLMSEVKERFGNVSLSDLLEPARLAKVFSEPAK